MLSMVIGDRCSPQTLRALAEIDPERWYHGQLLEAILDEVAAKSADAPYQLGRAVYFMAHTQLEQMGVPTPEILIVQMPTMWTHVTRGDSGWFRTELLTPTAAHVEMAQPYNCDFEEGAFVGFLDGLGCERVTSRHTTCVRKGAAFCTLELTWSAPSKVV